MCCGWPNSIINQDNHPENALSLIDIGYDYEELCKMVIITWCYTDGVQELSDKSIGITKCGWDFTPCSYYSVANEDDKCICRQNLEVIKKTNWIKRKQSANWVKKWLFQKKGRLNTQFCFQLLEQPYLVKVKLGILS